MIRCPECGAAVPEGDLSCPTCGLNLGMTQKFPAFTGAWCDACGALVPTGAEVCPKCGKPMPAAEGDEPVPPVEPPAPRPQRDIDLPDISAAQAVGASIPEIPEIPAQVAPAVRIESAIPAEDDPTSAVVRQDRIPRTRVFAFAAVVALALVGGATLWITHPWDATYYDTKAKVPADTTMAGFPGTLDQLKGQDVGASATSDATDSLYDSILADYERLGELAALLDQCYSDFDYLAYDSSLEGREAAAASANQASIDISNLISQIDGLDDGGGVYADDLDNLGKLGNWLRNRADALTAGWAAALGSDDPAADRASIEAVAHRNFSGGEDSFKVHFDENYEAWRPEQAKL